MQQSQDPRSEPRKGPSPAGPCAKGGGSGTPAEEDRENDDGFLEPEPPGGAMSRLRDAVIEVLREEQRRRGE